MIIQGKKAAVSLIALFAVLFSTISYAQLAQEDTCDETTSCEEEKGPRRLVEYICKRPLIQSVDSIRRNRVLTMYNHIKNNPERRHPLNSENVIGKWKFLANVTETPDRKGEDQFTVDSIEQHNFASDLDFDYMPNSSDLSLKIENSYCNDSIVLSKVNFENIDWLEYRAKVEWALTNPFATNNDGIDATYTFIKAESPYFLSYNQKFFDPTTDVELKSKTIREFTQVFYQKKDGTNYNVNLDIGACFITLHNTFLACVHKINIPDETLGRYSSDHLQRIRNGYQYDPESPLAGYFRFEYSIYEKVRRGPIAHND